VFFDYITEEDFILYKCDSCGYEEEEQILMGGYPCPECDDGQMFP
jgi:DNA-directed RNA polymerase subunit RPC12/RpoP